MTDEALISRLAVDLYRSAAETAVGAFPEWLFELLRGAISFDYGIWALAARTNDGLETHQLHLYRLPYAMMADYNQVARDDPLVDAMYRSPGVTFRASANEIPAEAVAMRDFVQR